MGSIHELLDGGLHDGAARAAKARPFAGSSAGAAPAPQRPAVIVRTAPSGGFSWTDAAIGAASGVAAGAVGLGGARRARGRRRIVVSA